MRPSIQSNIENCRSTLWHAEVCQFLYHQCIVNESVHSLAACACCVGGHCKRQSCANKGLLTQPEAFLCGKWRVELLWFSDATMYHMRGKARDRQRLVGLGLEVHVALIVLWHGEKDRASTSRQYSPAVFDVGDPETTSLEMVTFPCYRMQHCASVERELLYIAYPLIHRI